MSNWAVQSAGGAPFVGAGINADVRLRRLTAGSPAHTPGAWVEVITSCPVGMRALVLHTASDNGGAVVRSLIDIGIGAAGSEVVVAPSIPLIASSFRFSGDAVVLPLAFAPGTRVAARIQSSTASSSDHFVTVLAQVGGQLAPVGGGGLVAMADNRAISRGTLVQNNYGGGAWVEMTAATPARFRGLFVCYSGDGGYNTHSTEIAVGAAGSERTILERIAMLRSEQGQHPHISGPFWVSIPAGVRLAAKTHAGSTPMDPYIHLLGIL